MRKKVVVLTLCSVVFGIGALGAMNDFLPLAVGVVFMLIPGSCLTAAIFMDRCE